MVVGLRSGPLGHASAGGNDCDATTYYARFRNDGTWDFEKELKHPGSTYWSGSGYNKQDPLWNGLSLPPNRWIGMKYVVYNSDNNTHVTLELYIDSVSHGNPANGGRWEMVGTVTDAGTWPSGDVAECGYEQNSIILNGHGTVLMRTDGDTAVYKMVSVREIVPEKTAVMRHKARHLAASERNCSLQPFIADQNAAMTSNLLFSKEYQLFTLQGRLCSKSSGYRQRLGADMQWLPAGVYLRKLIVGFNTAAP
jgi:hypothetical protein